MERLLPESFVQRASGLGEVKFFLERFYPNKLSERQQFVENVTNVLEEQGFNNLKRSEQVLLIPPADLEKLPTKKCPERVQSLSSSSIFIQRSSNSPGFGTN